MNIDLSYTQPQIDIFFPPVPQRHAIIPKGRRFGATRGAAHAFIEWGCEGMPMLWGDTIHGNIARYVDRYFLPALTSNGIRHEWREQKGVLKIMDGYVDFRSADNPANWEGFGYRKIVLNEAGIILKDPYLYTNAVRPMMIDPGAMCELYALGVPKGKTLKDGSEHPFYTMWKMVGTEGYRGQAYSSYDNPMLDPAEVKKMEEDIGIRSPEMVRQEIWGEFIDKTSGNPFAHAFDRAKHVKPCTLDQRLPVIISIDFNVDPFCAIVCQEQGKRFAITHEISIKSGTIEELCTRIRAIAPGIFQHQYTGDRSGAARRIQMKSTASLWDDFLSVMPARESQLKLPHNPTHKDSREQTNYVLYHHPEFVIDPSCTGVIYDMENVEVDSDLSIIKSDRSKSAQRADFLDDVRYAINTYLSGWIETHRRLNAVQRLPQGPRPVQVFR